MKLGELLSYHKPCNKEEVIEIYQVENLDNPIEILTATKKSKYNNCNIDRFYVLDGKICVLIY